MILSELTWIDKQGRDDDGDRYRHHLLIDGAGRIFARVYEPTKDGYSFVVRFDCDAPKEFIGSSDESVYFLELEFAKRFAEQIVCHPERAKPDARKPAQRKRENKTTSPT